MVDSSSEDADYGHEPELRRDDPEVSGGEPEQPGDERHDDPEESGGEPEQPGDGHHQPELRHDDPEESGGEPEQRPGDEPGGSKSNTEASEVLQVEEARKADNVEDREGGSGSGVQARRDGLLEAEVAGLRSELGEVKAIVLNIGKESSASMSSGLSYFLREFMLPSPSALDMSGWTALQICCERSATKEEMLNVAIDLLEDTCVPPLLVQRKWFG